MTKIAAGLSAMDPDLETQYPSVAEALMGNTSGNYQYGMMRDRLQGEEGQGSPEDPAKRNLPTADSLSRMVNDKPMTHVEDHGADGLRVYFKSPGDVTHRILKVSLNGDVEEILQDFVD